jgi:hypothetical protein
MNVTIGLTGNPMPAVNMGTNPVCKNGTVQLCPTVWGWSNYQWYKNGVVVAAPAGVSSCITLSSADTGIYTLKATNGSGCWTTLSTPINVKYDSTCNGNVTSGGSGGVETKTLGDVIAQRLYGNAVNSVVEVLGYNNSQVFTHSPVIVNGVASIKLSDIVPAKGSILGTDNAYITTPLDLKNYVTIDDVFAVDYTNNSSTKAVAFATKTLGEVYTHTKPVCDRLKGSQLLEVTTINVKGHNLVAYKVQQCTGEIEYAINLSAGTSSNRNTIKLQSNWFTTSYANDEQMYNMQLWAVSYNMVQEMAAKVITNLEGIATVEPSTSTTTDMPQAFVINGKRNGTTVNLTIQNNIAASSNAYFAIEEKATETATKTTRVVAINSLPVNQSTISLDVKDAYEATIYLYVNGKKTDMLYLNDGTWSKEVGVGSSLQSFVVSNDLNATNINNNEYRLLRNVHIKATTSNYVNVYKSIGTKCDALNISNYNSFKFTGNAVGSKSVTITLVSKNIANWADQYSYTQSLDGDREYAINLSSFASKKYTTSVNHNELTQVVFSFNSSRGTATQLTAGISNARFTTASAVVNENSLSVGLYPNPTTGKVTLNYTASSTQQLQLKVIEVATGRVVYAKLLTPVKGNNTQPLMLQSNVANGVYIVTLDGDAVKYNATKLVISK